MVWESEASTDVSSSMVVATSARVGLYRAKGSRTCPLTANLLTAAELKAETQSRGLARLWCVVWRVVMAGRPPAEPATAHQCGDVAW